MKIDAEKIDGHATVLELKNNLTTLFHKAEKLKTDFVLFIQNAKSNDVNEKDLEIYNFFYELFSNALSRVENILDNPNEGYTHDLLEKEIETLMVNADFVSTQLILERFKEKMFCQKWADDYADLSEGRIELRDLAMKNLELNELKIKLEEKIREFENYFLRYVLEHRVALLRGGVEQVGSVHLIKNAKSVLKSLSRLSVVYDTGVNKSGLKKREELIKKATGVIENLSSLMIDANGPRSLQSGLIDAFLEK